MRRRRYSRVSLCSVKTMIFLLVPSGDVMCFDWRILDNSSHFLSVPALRTSAAMTTRPRSVSISRSSSGRVAAAVA